MRLFGHPLHLLLIHFPTALLPFSFICSFIGYFNHNDYLAYAAFISGAAGALTGIFALITGAIDVVRVYYKHQESLSAALIHGFLNLTVIIGYGIALYTDGKAFPNLHFDSLAELITKGVLVFIMLIGNFIGGNLIIKNKVLD
jgi:uncharacterized membrane protein